MNKAKEVILEIFHWFYPEDVDLIDKVLWTFLVVYIGGAFFGVEYFRDWVMSYMGFYVISIILIYLIAKGVKKK